MAICRSPEASASNDKTHVVVNPETASTKPSYNVFRNVPGMDIRRSARRAFHEVAKGT